MHWQFLFHLVKLLTCSICNNVPGFDLFLSVLRYAELSVLYGLLLICLKTLDNSLKILMRYFSSLESLLHCVIMQSGFKSELFLFLANFHFHWHESIDVLHEIVCFYQFLFYRFEVILLCFAHVEVNFACFDFESLSKLLNGSLFEDVVYLFGVNRTTFVHGKLVFGAVYAAVFI